MIAAKRSWMTSSASSHEMRSNDVPPRGPVRRSGVLMRRSPCTKPGYIAGTFAHTTPLVYGFACEPRMATIFSSSTVTVRLQVSGQSSVQTLCRSITALCRSMVAAGKSQSLRPHVSHYAVEPRGVAAQDLPRDPQRFRRRDRAEAHQLVEHPAERPAAPARREPEDLGNGRRVARVEHLARRRQREELAEGGGNLSRRLRIREAEVREHVAVNRREVAELARVRIGRAHV